MTHFGPFWQWFECDRSDIFWEFLWCLIFVFLGVWSNSRKRIRFFSKCRFQSLECSNPNFSSKTKKSSEKGFSFILFKKEVFHFNSFHPYLGQLLQSLHQQDKGDAGKSATSSSYNAATSRALPLSYNTFLSVKRQDSSWIQT